MQTTSLTALVHQHLTSAQQASNGRSAHTVYGGQEHTLRQTLIALASGHSLDEHESPGEATLQALPGAVRLPEDESTWDGSAGALLVIPLGRHCLQALEDSVVLLTVAVQR